MRLNALAETREALAGSTQRQMRERHIGRADLRRYAAHYIASYRCYSWPIAPRRFSYGKVRYAVDRPMRSTVAKSIADAFLYGSQPSVQNFEGQPRGCECPE